MNNPLEPVWQWYQAARDSMRIALRVIQKKIPRIITKKHLFHALSATAAQQRIEDAQQELDKMAVVAMVAIFERSLRDHLTQVVLPSFPATDSFYLAIQEQLRADIEYWNLPARVIEEVFKKRVPADLCGMAKQIILYRNEIAHGHVAGEPPPGYADPRIVFQRLTRFLENAALASIP